jgi:hypothetical protein
MKTIDRCLLVTIFCLVHVLRDLRAQLEIAIDKVLTIVETIRSTVEHVNIDDDTHSIITSDDNDDIEDVNLSTN